ncbi:MAG: hypothetical protein K2L23_03725 [Odoribacter sp.]|nr:hypothetical protein [Odoribacter sp.]
MFNLILNVIRDKDKQFVYPEEWERSGVLKNRERKVFRLLSRLIRYLQVRRVACFGSDAALLPEYLAQVYQDTSVQCNLPDGLEQADFIYIGRKACGFLPEGFSLSAILRGLPEYIVVADIYKDPFNARIWSRYRDMATVSVDMMWYGLLFFDEKIQKGKYNLMI